MVSVMIFSSSWEQSASSCTASCWNTVPDAAMLSHSSSSAVTPKALAMLISVGRLSLVAPRSMWEMLEAPVPRALPGSAA